VVDRLSRTVPRAARIAPLWSEGDAESRIISLATPLWQRCLRLACTPCRSARLLLPQVLAAPRGGDDRSPRSRQSSLEKGSARLFYAPGLYLRFVTRGLGDCRIPSGRSSQFLFPRPDTLSKGERFIFPTVDFFGNPSSTWRMAEVLVVNLQLRISFLVFASPPLSPGLPA